MKRIYLVVFEKSSDGWSAFAPDVDGTGGLGDTIDQARQSLREGIGYILHDCAERNLPLPEAVSTSVDFSEFDPDPAQSHYEVEWLTVEIPKAGSDTRDLAQRAA